MGIELDYCLDANKIVENSNKKTKIIEVCFSSVVVTILRQSTETK